MRMQISSTAALEGAHTSIAFLNKTSASEQVSGPEKKYLWPFPLLMEVVIEAMSSELNNPRIVLVFPVPMW